MFPPPSFNPNDAVTVLTSGAIGLMFPDIDLRMLRVLHHRSIITHNVIIPMLFLLDSNPSVRLAAAGFIMGVSVHLSADVLSRPVGFGLVWLPYPIKSSLGWFSPLWLAANALVGLIASRVMFVRAQTKMDLVAYIAGAGTLALGYAVWHERSLLYFASFVLIFVFSLMMMDWLVSQQWLRPTLLLLHRIDMARR